MAASLGHPPAENASAAASRAASADSHWPQSSYTRASRRWAVARA